MAPKIEPKQLLHQSNKNEIDRQRRKSEKPKLDGIVRCPSWIVRRLAFIPISSFVVCSLQKIWRPIAAGAWCMLHSFKTVNATYAVHFYLLFFLLRSLFLLLLFIQFIHILCNQFALKLINLRHKLKRKPWTVNIHPYAFMQFLFYTLQTTKAFKQPDASRDCNSIRFCV